MYYSLKGVDVRDASEAYRYGALFDAVVTEHHKLDLIRNVILDTDYSFTKSEYETTKMMRASFMSDQFCAGLMKTSVLQHEVYSTLTLTWNKINFTIFFRGKLDFFIEKLRIVVDLKSTAATSQNQFESACEQFGYWRQMVVYMLLTGSEKAVLIGVSKSRPYKVFKIHIVKGDDRWNKGLLQLSELAFKYWVIHS